MSTKKFKRGQSVMVQTTKPEFESADGMRGVVTKIHDEVVTIECRIVGECEVIRMPADELVHCWVRA